MSMHGATGEEGYWLKHVAVAEFDVTPAGYECMLSGKARFRVVLTMNQSRPPTRGVSQ